MKMETMIRFHFVIQFVETIINGFLSDVRVFFLLSPNLPTFFRLGLGWLW